MEAWLAFGRGPLFRLCFTLMALGTLRLVVLTLLGMAETWRRSPDRILPWPDLAAATLGWLFPGRKLWTKRPIHSTIAFLFHLGLLGVPLFLGAHVLLWKRAIDIAWPTLPQSLADRLTLLTIFTGLCLFLGRILDPSARAISRPQEFLWPLILVIPFTTGYACANLAVSPAAYYALMLVHLYAGNLIMALLPFTTMAHCVLAPLSQFVTGLCWKLQPGAGQRVAATLGYADRPTWIERPRVAAHAAPTPSEEA